MDGMVQRGIKRVIWHRNERRKRLGAQGRERERECAREAGRGRRLQGEVRALA